MVNTMPEKLEILYEDNHLIGILKPGGLLVQGDRTGDDTALAMVKRYVKNKYNKPGNVFIGLVHRIDRPVSGVVLFAKTSKAASRLSKEFHDRKTEKTYLAVTAGYLKNDNGELVAHLERAHNRSRAVDRPTVRSKEASLTRSVLDRRGGLSLLEILPHTGRHHQIRAQLGGFSFPIVGDIKYGAIEPLADKTIALHGARLRVRHPVGGELLTVEARPPVGGPWRRFQATIDSYFERGAAEPPGERRKG
jgi:23S rRNA pseudouridine1911/1915/1917 synthase